MDWESNDFSPDPQATSQAVTQAIEQSTGTPTCSISQTHLPTPVSEYSTPEPFAYPLPSNRNLQRDGTPFLASDPPESPLLSPTRHGLPSPSPEPALSSHESDDKCSAGATDSINDGIDVDGDEEDLGHNEQAGDGEEGSNDGSDGNVDELAYPSDPPSFDHQSLSAAPTFGVDEIPQTIHNHVSSGVEEGNSFRSNDPSSPGTERQTRHPGGCSNNGQEEGHIEEDGLVANPVPIKSRDFGMESVEGELELSCGALWIVGSDEEIVSPVSPTNSTLSTDSSSSVPPPHTASYSPVAARATTSRNYIQIYTRDQKTKRKQRPKVNDLTEPLVKRPRLPPSNQVTAGPSAYYFSTAVQPPSSTSIGLNPLSNNIHKPTRPRPTAKTRLAAKEVKPRPRSIAVSNPKPLQTSSNSVPGPDTHAITDIQLAHWHGVLGRMCYKLKGNQEEMADRDEVDGVFREMLMMKDAFVKTARNHDLKRRENWNIPKLREQLEFFTSEETEAYGESVQRKAQRILDAIGNGKAASLPMMGMSG
ncbi:hypothetical protein AAF712_002195 [Marasmius tenuissimus]|uniref:Uncharacterized protein n=1 Tax=Marasmius tenuissimus TaxID=585030 RepID=A0ABR3ADC7_9AGAR